ncbi:nucleobase:cation symporter-2 family protein [Halomonas sp. I1]|uniref:nucleobase:cation symporter-2 family protein n=1 Tax=Halomonas sp. I1 TaxID=393536 RepID=UPI0028DEF8A2|nr:nucleobase:cation symporter-2 family protein [Halomonas sp. I1]MDT8893107.1 nucleobase:cation symporter-2 family protein [Halomonas sp. I1]
MNNDKDDGASVDEVLPAQQTLMLSLQHLLAAYASLAVTPLVVASALEWSPSEVTLILSACLVTSGLCTLIQCLGILGTGIGVKLPVVQGTTIAAIPPLIMIGSSGGFNAMFGATIVAGLFAFLVAPYWSRMLHFFPPVVTGTVIAVIGLSLFPVAIMWMGGGGGFGPQEVATPDMVLGLATMLFVITVIKFGRGIWARTAILLGLVVGTLVAALFGLVDFSNVGQAEWLAVVYPFAMGPPTFSLSASVAMILAMVVTMVESTGDYIAIGEVCDKRVDQRKLTAGLRAEGLGTVLGGIMNSFPYTTFSQNTGVLRVSGVKSRWVVAVCGGMMILLGFFPKLSAIATSIPLPVLGGCGVVLFGSITCTGLKIIGRVDLDDNGNLIIVGVSIGMAMIVVCNPTFFDALPDGLRSVLNSAITLGGISAILLNLLFNVLARKAPADRSGLSQERG